MTTIYLLRHGSLLGDSQKRFVGQIDKPLSSEGIGQAKALAEALLPCPIGTVHCSDLRRSRQTAEIIAETLGVPLSEHRELREMSLGEWDGQARQEVAEEWAGEFVARGRAIENFQPPGGESFADCLARALPTWEAITASTDEAVAIVGHAGINRLLLCRLLGMPMAELFRLEQDYGCINIVEGYGGRTRVKLVNGSPTDLAAQHRKNCIKTKCPESICRVSMAWSGGAANSAFEPSDTNISP